MFIVLFRRGDAVFASIDGHLSPVDDIAEFVRTHEPQRPRWVWDDTTQWYPSLLSAGISVRHCADLRLRHTILRNSPLVDQGHLDDEQAKRWDHFRVDTPQAPALFGQHEDEPLDVVAEFERQERAVAQSDAAQRLRLLLMAESSAALIAAEMTHAGLPWRTDIHDRILTEHLGPRPKNVNVRPPRLESLVEELRREFNAPDLNPDSPGDLLRSLQRAGLILDNTRSHTLERLKHPGIPPLLEYRKLQRLHTANGWRWMDTWVHDGRYRTTFIPGGVVSGRWAADGGGALSLPAQLREAVTADEGWSLVVADVKQLEPRVLIGMSEDRFMADAARSHDLYQDLVESGVVPTRNDAKLGMLGAMYGATQGESGAMVARLTQRFPRAFGLVEAAARRGERGEPVHTFLGRGSPVPDAEWVYGIPDANGIDPGARDRRSWGRFTRNFVVQGTGAEWALCWLALLRNRLTEISECAHLVFFLHDEVIVHTPREFVDEVSAAVRDAADNAGALLFGSFPVDFPLSISAVQSYAEAK